MTIYLNIFISRMIHLSTKGIDTLFLSVYKLKLPKVLLVIFRVFRYL